MRASLFYSPVGVESKAQRVFIIEPSRKRKRAGNGIEPTSTTSRDCAIKAGRAQRIVTSGNALARDAFSPLYRRDLKFARQIRSRRFATFLDRDDKERSVAAEFAGSVAAKI